MLTTPLCTYRANGYLACRGLKETFVSDDDANSTNKQTSSPGALHIVTPNGLIIRQNISMIPPMQIGRAMSALTSRNPTSLTISSIRTPLPLIPVLDYSDSVRKDVRTLKPSLPVPIMDKGKLPQTVSISGKQFNKSFNQDAIFIQNDKTDMLGAFPINGDLDLHVFVIIKRKEVYEDKNAVMKIAQGYKKVCEWIQDRFYEISNQHMRYTRVCLCITGLQNPTGEMDDLFKTKVIPFTIGTNCDSTGQRLVPDLCRHIANTYEWDATYARQALVFTLEDFGCKTIITGEGDIGCYSRCAAYLMSGTEWNMTSNWFQNKSTEYVIVHELLHNLGLRHANILDEKYEEEYRDTSSVMGWSGLETYPHSLNMYSLGWLDNRKLVDLDTLNTKGILITVPSSLGSCVALVAPVIIVKPGMSTFSGFVPYPVLTLGMKRNAAGLLNSCVIHTYGPVPLLHTSIGLTYAIPQELGSGKKQVTIDLFHPKLGSFLPPYVKAQSGITPFDVTPFLPNFKLPLSNKRPNMKVRITINGTYNGKGDMQVRIQRV